MLRLGLLLAALAATGAVALAAVGDRAPTGTDIGREVRDAGRKARDAVRGERRRSKPKVPASRCPAGVPACRAVRGRIVFRETVDADGDGDLHVVIADGSVTAPGLTAVDVRPGLRPRPDPRIGDHASAAGPVQTGRLGQSQIHALEFHHRTR